MTEPDWDLAVLKLLSIVKGGQVLIRRDGVDTLSLGLYGEWPEIGIKDFDNLRSMMPQLTPAFMERMRRISHTLSESQRNIRITVNGTLFLNLGSEGTFFKDIEGFASFFMKRIGKMVRRNG